MGADMPVKPPFVYEVEPVSDSYVKLVPFDPDRHLGTFFRLSGAHPELYAHIPWGPWSSVAELRSEFYDRSPTHDLSIANPESFTFAIIDRTRAASAEDPEGELAGTMSFAHTSFVNMSTEIGFVVILPPYQRTHVTSRAIGLALHYALERPENGGLGIRRVHWKTSTKNFGSIKVAERMGFTKVGVIPWCVRYVRANGGQRLETGRIFHLSAILRTCGETPWNLRFHGIYGRNMREIRLERP